MIHPNSLKAYRDEWGKLSKRELDILGILQRHGALTDREVMEYLGFKDPNAARPRITDLIKRRLVVECGNTKDKLTGKTVRVTRIEDALPAEPHQPKLALDFNAGVV